MLKDKRIVMVTGASGYVGEMLCEQFAKRDDVQTVIAIDKEPQTDYLKSVEKIVYFQHNLAEAGWQNKVLPYMPDTIVHTAWQIRSLYGQEKKQWHWNIDGSEAIFKFALTNRFVKKLIHFSTAASYSARADNSLDHFFTESEGFRDDEYLYAKEKKMAEENLFKLYNDALMSEQHYPQITILRPAAITGPRGRFLRVRFGLQSALQGNLQENLINKIITTLTSVMPATRGWVRQFIHEDDVVDIVSHVVFEQNAWSYEVFNITPVGAPVYPKDMAKAVGKRVLPIYPWMARLAFWMFWHLTRGKIPTGKGVWRFYSFPILMSGDKLTVIYRCRYSSFEALAYTNGRYEEFVPDEVKRKAPIKNQF